ncbi:hypothetical protein O181_008087 [Austropuccinia psidii MF-1]|uniref:GAG-pre-integrase domain-containing protein n=1 Tax=Austropuccinia psidii MF-1 TaxID=1389203 RepID=A0A9Q3GJ35_9BASI|nr:hypothetical protein [Austropuccinia psidii MF-1]
MKVDYHLPTDNKAIAKESPWHKRLGHAGRSIIKSMGLPPSNDSCEIRNLNRINLLPFKDHFEPAYLPLDCVHVDLVGSISPPSISGFRYFLTIVNQSTSYKIVQLLKNKSDAFNKKVVISRHVWFNESIFPELKQQGGNADPLNVTWDSIEGQAVVNEFHVPLENQEPVDEVWMPSIQDTMPTSELELVDEVLPANEIASLPASDGQAQPPVCIKVSAVILINKASCLTPGKLGLFLLLRMRL